MQVDHFKHPVKAMLIYAAGPVMGAITSMTFYKVAKSLLNKVVPEVADSLDKPLKYCAVFRCLDNLANLIPVFPLDGYLIKKAIKSRAEQNSIKYRPIISHEQAARHTEKIQELLQEFYNLINQISKCENLDDATPYFDSFQVAFSSLKSLILENNIEIDSSITKFLSGFDDMDNIGA